MTATPGRSEHSPTTLDCEPGTAPEAALLASWYAAHSQVRRLWAIDEVEMIRIVMKIEPTIDGYDALPVWLANSDHWIDELAAVLKRNVHLEMLGVTSAASLIASNGGLIAEISWREEYCS